MQDELTLECPITTTALLRAPQNLSLPPMSEELQGMSITIYYLIDTGGVEALHKVVHF